MNYVLLLTGSSLVSSTGEPTPSTVRQYGGLTRKYASDGGSGGDELAACLPPDLRHLLSATTASIPSSHHRQTTTQRLQQHGLLRSSAATTAANSLVRFKLVPILLRLHWTGPLNLNQH